MGKLTYSVIGNVAGPEPPVLRRLRSRFFGRSEPTAGAAFLRRLRPPAPAGSFRKAKKTSFALVIFKHEVGTGTIYRDNMIQK